MPGARTVSSTITIGGTTVCPTTLTRTNGLQQAGMQLRMTLPANDIANLRDDGPLTVVLSLGWDGSLQQRFVGTTRMDNPKYRPALNDLVALGPLSALSAGAAHGGVITGTEVTAVEALLAKAGITSSISIDGTVPPRSLGQYNPLRVGRGDSELLAALRRIDSIFDFWTADQADGTIRRRKWPLNDPGALTIGLLAECATGDEVPLLNPISWSRDSNAVRNAQLVLGYTRKREDADYAAYFNRPYAALVASSPFVPTPPQYSWGQPFEDDLIENGIYAIDICQALMKRRNKLQGTISAVIEGRSDIEVGQLWNVRAESVGLLTATPCVLTDIQDIVTPSSWVAQLTLEPLVGAIGSGIDPRPIGYFTQDGLGGGGTGEGVIVSCSGDAICAISDGPFTFTWYNTANGTTKSGPDATTYIVAFTEDELAGGATIYLEVEDPATRLRSKTTGGNGFGSPLQGLIGSPSVTPAAGDPGPPTDLSVGNAADWSSGYPPDSYVGHSLGLVVDSAGNYVTL